VIAARQQEKDSDIAQLKQEHQSDFRELVKAKQQISEKEKLINKMTDQIKTALLESEKQTTVHKETLERKDGKIKELQDKIRKIKNRWMNTSANRL
jgi:hypothetical protein